VRTDPLFNTDAIAQWALDVGIARFMFWKWGWPIAEIVHFFGLCLLFGTVALFDLRMLGVARGIRMQDLHRMVPFGVAGFALSITTGFMFVVTMPDQYVHNPAFVSKMSLLALAGINMVMFYATTWRAVRSAGPDAMPPLRARIFGAVSLVCWLGVIACGRVITAYRPPWDWCFWCR
jgi:hypothetical protein